MNAGTLEAFRLAFATKKHPEGWEYIASPYGTAAALLDGLWKEHPRRLKAPDLTGTPWDPAVLEIGSDTVERPYTWVRPRKIKPASPHLHYFQAFDINGQFLSACSGLPCGIGVPDTVDLRYPAGGPLQGADRTLPGYHYAAAEGPTGIPEVLQPGWHATPIVAVAQTLGLRVEVLKSYVWHDHCKYLDPWYKAMRDARTYLLNRADPAAVAALKLLKDCYTKLIGGLRGKDARERNPAMYQPAWYDSILSQANARQYLTLHRLARIGVPIIAVHLDTVIIESAHDLQKVYPPGITLTPQLGKYKPAGVITAKEGRALLYPEGRTNIHALTKRLREMTL
jgi:hypothetical protein